MLEQHSRVRVRFVAADTGTPLVGALQGNDIAYSVRTGVWEDALAPGRDEYDFRAQGYAGVPLEFTLEPGQDLDLGEIRVPRELTVEGRVLDAEAGPWAAASSSAGATSAAPCASPRNRRYASDEDGHYVIPGLAAARYPAE